MINLPITTPFMLNKKGDLLECGETHPYIMPYYDMSLEKALENLFFLHTADLIWFYDNSDERIKNDIMVLCTTLKNSRLVLDTLPHKEYIENVCNEVLSSHGGFDDPSTSTVAQALSQLNLDTNNAFCKVRTSNYKYNYGGDNGEIYFRLTNSDDFNWLDVIWNVCVGFKPCIKKVSILKDYQTFGKQFDYVSIKGTPINHLPIDEFLVLR